MIDIIFQAGLLFVTFLKYMIYIDVIMSWLTLLGINIIVWPIRWVLDPIYRTIESIVPTHFSGVSFTPVIVLLMVFFLEALLISLRASIGV